MEDKVYLVVEVTPCYTHHTVKAKSKKQAIERVTQMENEYIIDSINQGAGGMTVHSVTLMKDKEKYL